MNRPNYWQDTYSENGYTLHGNFNAMEEPCHLTLLRDETPVEFFELGCAHPILQREMPEIFAYLVKSYKDGIENL
jgi:hypothetical protein